MYCSLSRIMCLYCCALESGTGYDVFALGERFTCRNGAMVAPLDIRHTIRPIYFEALHTEPLVIDAVISVAKFAIQLLVPLCYDAPTTYAMKILITSHIPGLPASCSLLLEFFILMRARFACSRQLRERSAIACMIHRGENVRPESLHLAEFGSGSSRESRHCDSLGYISTHQAFATELSFESAGLPGIPCVIVARLLLASKNDRLLARGALRWVCPRVICRFFTGNWLRIVAVR